MRKFDDQDAPPPIPADPAAPEPVLRLVVPRPPAVARSASSAELKALVDFAVGRGYHEHWNSAPRVGVTPCKSKDFPTDKDRDSN